MVKAFIIVTQAQLDVCMPWPCEASWHKHAGWDILCKDENKSE